MTARLRVLAGLAASLIAAGAAATGGEGRVQNHEPAALVSDFELMDQNGKPFRLDTRGGQWAFVFFGFTHCPNVCPLTLQKLRLVNQALAAGGDSPPRTILISVDAERDSPEVLKAYLAGWSKDFIGLTGDPKLVRRIAERFSAVFFKGLPADASGAYLVDHTSQIYLVDGAGRLRATIFDATVDQIADTVHKLAVVSE